MKNDYRTFKLSLLTLAPIHIGNGEKYTSREFIYENKKFYVYVIISSGIVKLWAKC